MQGAFLRVGLQSAKVSNGFGKESGFTTISHDMECKRCLGLGLGLLDGGFSWFMWLDFGIPIRQRRNLASEPG
jgi:hypothetical protein